jgi:hypothetical protein
MAAELDLPWLHETKEGEVPPAQRAQMPRGLPRHRTHALSQDHRIGEKSVEDVPAELFAEAAILLFVAAKIRLGSVSDVDVEARRKQLFTKRR